MTKHVRWARFADELSFLTIKNQSTPVTPSLLDDGNVNNFDCTTKDLFPSSVNGRSYAKLNQEEPSPNQRRIRPIGRKARLLPDIDHGKEDEVVVPKLVMGNDDPLLPERSNNENYEYNRMNTARRRPKLQTKLPPPRKVAAVSVEREDSTSKGVFIEFSDQSQPRPQIKKVPKYEISLSPKPTISRKQWLEACKPPKDTMTSIYSFDEELAEPNGAMQHYGGDRDTANPGRVLSAKKANQQLPNKLKTTQKLKYKRIDRILPKTHRSRSPEPHTSGKPPTRILYHEERCQDNDFKRGDPAICNGKSFSKGNCSDIEKRLRDVSSAFNGAFLNDL